jgi:hypothetical protein
MTSRSSQADAPVRLKLAALVAAARAATLEGRHELATGVTAAVQAVAEQHARTHDIVANFLRLAQSGMPDAVLPFTADPLTTALVAIEYPMSPSDTMVVFSSASRIDLGYFHCAHKGLQYVDRASTSIASKSPLRVPDTGISPEWFDALQGMQSDPIRLSFSPEAGDALHIEMPAAEAARWSKARTRLTLLRSGSDGSVKKRLIGNLPVPKRMNQKQIDEGSRCTLALQLSSEQQIELHAASFDGWWVHVGDSQRLELISQAPSLDPEAEGCACRVNLPMRDFNGLLGAHKTIETDRALAAELVARYRWVAPEDNLIAWLSMAAQGDEALSQQQH